MQAKKLSFKDIEVGLVSRFSRTITNNDVSSFSILSGDLNPLHVNTTFGKESKFKQNVVHGMLTASLFSALIGMYCPGENSLYLSQTLQFKMPLFYGEKVDVVGTVIRKIEAVKIITMKTEILRDHDLIISGEASIQLIK